MLACLTMFPGANAPANFARFAAFWQDSAAHPHTLSGPRHRRKTGLEPSTWFPQPRSGTRCGCGEQPSQA